MTFLLFLFGIFLALGMFLLMADLLNRLRQYPQVKVTSIARGIGFGDELEYVDELTITHAPVSYTHLDVYKRQDHPVVCGEKGIRTPDTL